MRVPKYTPPAPTDTTPTLLTGGGAQYGQPCEQAWLNRPRLNWNIWLHMFEVELWKACALSLNIDPNSMQPERRLSFGNGPYFGEENFTNSSTKVAYEERLMLLTDHLSKSPFFSPNKLNMGKLPKLQEVKLDEFAAWGLSLEWKLPPELVALAQSQKSKTEAPLLISVPHKSPRDSRPWESPPEDFNVINGVDMYLRAAREIADAEGWDDSKLEKLQNLMEKALRTGELRRRCRKTGLVIAPPPDSLKLVSTYDDIYWLVSVEDVNAWLEKQGVAYRWRIANASPAKAQGEVKLGRPKTVEEKAKILRRIIEVMTQGEVIDDKALPGRAEDLLDACQRIEMVQTEKAVTFGGATVGAFKEWLKETRYGIKNGRTPRAEKKYWTDLCVKTMGKMPPDVFT